MTRLRKMMLEELERRNYSESTERTYVQTIEDLARYFKRPPDQLEPEHIRQYQGYLFRDRKLSPNTVNQRTGTLRFFFITVLRRSWSIADTPYPKRNFRLPKVLSQQQVAKLIASATTPFYRIILMTLYATGLRRAELAQVKVTDINSERMVIHVHGGKGRKDREVMLSPKCWMNYGSIGAVFGGSRKRGYSRAIAGTQRSIQSIQKWCGTPATKQPYVLGWVLTFTHTLYVTASPLTYWKPARTCEPFSSCSGIAIWKRQRSICTFPICVSARQPVRWMHCS